MKYPIQEHLLFHERRGQFARVFHELAGEMHAAGIDVTMLDDVIDAYQAVADIQADTAFKKGYDNGFHNGKANRRYEIYREQFMKKAAE